jgi:hypothetical protein
MIDFDVVTGPGPTEKPREREPAPRPVPHREQVSKPPQQRPLDRAIPRTSRHGPSNAGAGTMPGVDLSVPSELQDDEDREYIRGMAQRGSST